MSRLVSIHLGCLVKMPYVLDLDTVHGLEYFVLAMLHSIAEILNLDGLVRLKRLGIIDNNRVTILPSFAALQHLDTIAISYCIPVCCNGFITGKCDLTAFSCLDRTAQGEPHVECSTTKIADEDYAKLKATPGAVCPPNLPFDLNDIAATFESTDVSCGGHVLELHAPRSSWHLLPGADAT